MGRPVFADNFGRGSTELDEAYCDTKSSSFTGLTTIQHYALSPIREI